MQQNTITRWYAYTCRRYTSIQLSVAAALLTTTVLAGQAMAGSVNHTDDFFALGNQWWVTSGIGTGTGGTVSNVGRDSTGGNPGSHRKWTATLNDAPAGQTSGLWSINMFTDAGTFDPGAHGEVTHIDWQVDVNLAASSYMVVRQNNTLYVAADDNDPPSAPFRTYVGNEDASEFSALNANGSTNSSAHPDFSVNGDPFEIGFATTLSSGPANPGGWGESIWTIRADNYRATIYFDENSLVPTPAALPAGVALLGLAALRRPRRP